MFAERRKRAEIRPRTYNILVFFGGGGAQARSFWYVFRWFVCVCVCTWTKTIIDTGLACVTHVMRARGPKLIAPYVTFGDVRRSTKCDSGVGCADTHLVEARARASAT